MTTNEAREKLGAILKAGDLMLNAPSDMGEFIDKEAIYKSRIDQIFTILKQLGYRLIPELTLIDDEEIRILTGHTTSFDRAARDSQIEYSLNEVRRISQAQLSHTKKQLGIEK